MKHESHDGSRAFLVTQSCLTLCNPMDCSLPGSSVHGDSPDKNTGVGCHALLQGIFPTQGSNLGLPHCRQILYCPSHWGCPVSEQINSSCFKQPGLVELLDKIQEIFLETQWDPSWLFLKKKKKERENGNLTGSRAESNLGHQLCIPKQHTEPLMTSVSPWTDGVPGIQDF